MRTDEAIEFTIEILKVVLNRKSVIESPEEPVVHKKYKKSKKKVLEVKTPEKPLVRKARGPYKKKEKPAKEYALDAAKEIRERQDKLGVKCPECDQVCKGNIGLGVHMRTMHGRLITKAERGLE